MAQSKGVFPSKVHAFKPGESGNKKGRPPGKSLHTLLAELLEKATPAEVKDSKFIKEFLQKKNPKKKVTNAEALAARLLAKALVNGDMKAIKEIFDRIGGNTNPPGEIHMSITVNNEQRAAVVNDEINKLGE